MTRKVTLRVNELCRQRGWVERDLVYHAKIAPLTARNLLRDRAEPNRATKERLLDAFDLDDVGLLYRVEKYDGVDK